MMPISPYQIAQIRTEELRQEAERHRQIRAATHRRPRLARIRNAAGQRLIGIGQWLLPVTNRQTVHL